MQIFLSYASNDKELAEPIAFSLRARGHKVFFDRDDLPPGSEYDFRIEQAITSSGIFIFLITPDSVAKGRFTLTELEFARRKWGSGDGHVLPVLARATPLESVPSFLKSVTILEPAGNMAAEVASAVDPLAQRLASGQMQFYGVIAIASAIATYYLFTIIDSSLSNLGINLGIPLIPDIILGKNSASLASTPLSLILCGLPFGVALSLAFAYYIRPRFRQLSIVLYVMVGWFVAIQTVMSFGVRTQDVEQNVSCLSGTDSSDCAAYWRNRVMQGENIVGDMASWFVAGGVGALVTAVGVPLATRRLFSPLAIGLTTLAGAMVASGWYGTIWWMGFGFHASILYLYLIWQPVVAGMIGRLLR